MTNKSVEYVNDLPNTPAAASYYSQLVWAGNTAYLSGIIGINHITGKLEEGFKEQTETIFNNIENILKGVGLTFNDVAKVSIYLTDINNFSAMNEIYIKRMAGTRPARETVEVKGLALGSQIEITMTAYKSN